MNEGKIVRIAEDIIDPKFGNISKRMREITESLVKQGARIIRVELTETEKKKRR